MAITAQDVNKLRQMTGAGMMDCKTSKKQLTSSEKKVKKYLLPELTVRPKKE